MNSPPNVGPQIAGVNMARFTVDTHLFRELGELLVGRDSTALIELIKNAYDADATEVTVHGQQLHDPRRGTIIVSDNGTGMTSSQFESGFLRVASRLKDLGDRRSEIFHRRYTGAKGIGRLAAHKLARHVEIESVPRKAKGGVRESLHAVIDWDKIEACETLDDIDGTDAVVVEPTEVRSKAASGTSLTLTRLRRGWTPTERARFFAEVQSFDAPAFLREPLPTAVLGRSLLFSSPIARDQRTNNSTTDQGFKVSLEGDFASGEDYWGLVAEVANWVLEIRAEPQNAEVQVAISPTKSTRQENPEARKVTASIPHPDPRRGPFFDARILVREGRLKAKQDRRVWASRASGIRAYLEGFRVLPYGEPKDDWLSIDADYTRRPRQLEMLQELGLTSEGADPDEGLIRLPNNNYFGAVFLTQERAPSLRMLVNREGFVPEGGFDTLVTLVRTGVDLCTRVRAAAAFARRQKRKEERRGGGSGQGVQPGQGRQGGTAGRREDQAGLPDRLGEAADLIHQARAHVSAGNVDAAQAAAGAAARSLGEAKELAADVISERALLRVLASVGTQMAAFVHEINALLGAAQTVERALGELLEDRTLSREHRRSLRRIQSAAAELKRGLERQASYLMDVVTPDARRRRSRQPLVERFAAAVRLVQHQAERRGIEIENEIPPELRSPPMFPAEITTIFANLLTNAVKAAGHDGRIHAAALDEPDRVVVRIQNTGAAIDLTEAERWFKPFESTTSEVNPVLGQGMGLGLTITRSVLESYGASVKFVRPRRGFATAIEITFPK